MSRKIVCPQRIFDMFDTGDEDKLKIARGVAIEWLYANIADLEIGGEIVIPNPMTGAPESWTKTKEGGLNQ